MPFIFIHRQQYLSVPAKAADTHAPRHFVRCLGTLLPIFRDIGQTEYQADADAHIINESGIDLIVHVALYHALCRRGNAVGIDVGQIALSDKFSVRRDIAPHR